MFVAKEKFARKSNLFRKHLLCDTIAKIHENKVVNKNDKNETNKRYLIYKVINYIYFSQELKIFLFEFEVYKHKTRKPKNIL